jgi:hypothetical protein
LHTEWESADLWPRIRQAIEAEPKPGKPWWKQPRVWSLAAAVTIVIVLPVRFLLHPGKPPGTPSAQAGATVATGSRDFLTDQALREVEKNEAAYRQSIEKLSRLAQPELERASSGATVSAREKLMLLDSAIADTRSNIASNRFNVQLQNTLADLYRQKQQTLQELLSRDRKN